MTRYQRHSALSHVAYHDLLRSLKDEAISNLRGTPVKKARGGSSFWYDTYRIGNRVKTRYIGPDTEDIRERIARLKDLQRDQDARARERRRLIRILRAEDFLGVDAGTGSLFSALSNAGTFRLGGTIVGTHAFRLYEGELGIRMTLDQAAMTDDIDIAAFERLSLAIEDKAAPALGDVLKDLKFRAVPSLEPGRIWKWQQSTGNILVEFLTPSFSEDEGLRELPSLGVYAQSFHHLNYLISEPIAAAVTYRTGILIQIPRPERFAIHKLIVADRRRTGPEAGKAKKDLMQAEVLINILAEDRPDELLEAYQDAISSGPKWKERIDASLRRSPEIEKVLKNLLA